ncbi:MAG: hypothetical protein H0U53_10735 [Actinobacteria bacterium]|nr:hypothetical protein [Actinomycetota bacterium]
MRYQFFLDARDYVKYALLDDLMTQLSLSQLTLIWMLTPDVGNTHGSRRPKFDPNRPDLNHFFQQDPQPSLWDVKSYFEERGYQCTSYGDQPDGYITRANRTGYFNSIGDNLLTDALVLLDPDNGVEPRGGASPLHVKLDELRRLWSRMDDRSILVVYQHKPRVAADLFWPDVANRTAEALGSEVLVLPFKDVGFLVAGRRNLRDVLRTEGHQLHQTLTE